MAELKRTLNRLAGALFLCCLLFFGFSTHAFAATEGSQIITVTVPCTVTLEIGGHGSVTVDGTSYTGTVSFQKEPGTVLTYIITPESEYRISKVTYDGMNVTSELKNSRYKAPTLKGNVTVMVSFVKQTSPDSPQTGDDSRIGLWISLMCVSGIALIVLWRRSRQRD